MKEFLEYWFCLIFLFCLYAAACEREGLCVTVNQEVNCLKIGNSNAGK